MKNLACTNKEFRFINKKIKLQKSYVSRNVGKLDLYKWKIWFAQMKNLNYVK